MKFMKHNSFKVALICMWIGFAGCAPAENKTSRLKGGSEKNVDAKVLYRCPMHPHVTAHQPGESCSICGMALVKVDRFEPTYQKEGQEPGTKGQKTTGKTPAGRGKVRLSKEQVQLIGIRKISVLERDLKRTIRAPGRLAFDPELYTAQAEYISAVKQWQKVKDSSLADVKKSTQEMLRSAKIRLKIMGLSDRQIKTLGRKTSASEELLVAKKSGENWIYADVFEIDLPYVVSGLAVEVTAPYLAGEILSGEVVSIDQVIEKKTRTAKVRIQLRSSKVRLRPESYVTVKIYSPLGKHLAVPKTSLFDTGEDQYVFVEKSPGIFEPQKVRVKTLGDQWVGLGDQIPKESLVVVDGQFMLDSESRLNSDLSGGQSHD